MAVTTSLLSAAERQQFAADGYLVRRAQLDADEIHRLFGHFAQIHARRHVPGCFTAGDGPDPLDRWPRMMHPHRFDSVSRGLLLDARLFGVVSELYGEPALAAQTMFYWKPPGARGQALHQDDFYLRTRPGECMAAWLALDPSTVENGGLRVVPGSHVSPLQCPHPADETQSFSQHEVDLQSEWRVVPVDLRPGDILYFLGRLIHGSPPNESSRFRRSFICHYIPSSALECSGGYQPLLDSEGREVRTESPGGESDPCGGPEFRRG
ncbi:MAG: phytanoyl-CoA dioxygenase family protein [Armatimonadetes bacterium]|nr:phytanoyl-CoA dioxygenase family protein [Armatimonadota bacterium]